MTSHYKKKPFSPNKSCYGRFQFYEFYHLYQVVHEFMNEALPPDFYQYCSSGMFYWVDGRTQESERTTPNNQFRCKVSVSMFRY